MSKCSYWRCGNTDSKTFGQSLRTVTSPCKEAKARKLSQGNQRFMRQRSDRREAPGDLGIQLVLMIEVTPKPIEAAS
eukprot:415961-Amphidinium_carterae.1